MNRKFGNGSKNEIFTLHTPHQIPQISYKVLQPGGERRRKHCTDAAKEAEREAGEGLVEAQRADREEVVGEEEGVPEDESLPPRGGATCPHPHRGGGQIENTV